MRIVSPGVGLIVYFARAQLYIGYIFIQSPMMVAITTNKLNK